MSTKATLTIELPGDVPWLDDVSGKDALLVWAQLIKAIAVGSVQGAEVTVIQAEDPEDVVFRGEGYVDLDGVTGSLEIGLGTTIVTINVGAMTDEETAQNIVDTINSGLETASAFFAYIDPSLPKRVYIEATAVGIIGVMTFAVSGTGITAGSGFFFNGGDSAVALKFET